MTKLTTITAASCLAMAMVWTLLPAAHAGRDVRITYEENGAVETKHFDLLVVACEPTALAGVFEGMTQVEQRVEAAIQTYTLGTSVWDVRRQRGDGNTYTTRVALDPLAAGDGGVYSFRDEPRARTARTRRHTLVTAYQFANSTVSQDELMSIASAAVDGSSREYDWMGFEATPTLVEVLTTSNYFPHFSQDDIQAGLPWAVLDAQGAHNTIYVSSFGSFESVLSVFEYGNMLENTTQVQDAFEAARLASTRPKVAVIGAGPSGLLFASQQLKRAGLEDITFFEKQDEWGGKTQTLYLKAPGYPNKKKVPVEMTVAYLSNSYQALATMLSSQYGIKKPTRVNYGPEDLSARAVLDTATQTFTAYTPWLLQKPDGTQMTLDEFNIAAATYIGAHFSLVGWSMDTRFPIPPSQPEDLPPVTFAQYMDAIGIGYLTNFFTFAISAQGYGDINNIPAYYGLIWMTPDAFTTQLDVAASVTEKMAEAAGDAASRRLLVDSGSTLRHGGKVARAFYKSTAKEFVPGVRPSFEEAAALATRCHKRVLEGIDGEEEDSEDTQSLDGLYITQEGWGKVWDKLVFQERFRRKIKLGVNVLKIERRGLGDY